MGAGVCCSVEIVFDNLSDTKRKAEKAFNEIGDYKKEIDKKIIDALDSAQDSDSAGYVSTAINLANAKISELTNKAERFAEYKKKIETFSTEARAADKKVGSSIAAIADAKITKKGFFATIGSAIYNFFCVDLANTNDFTRVIANALKWVGNKADGILGKVRDWFKYGAGRYVLDIVVTVATVSASISAAYAAVVSMIATLGADSPGAVPIIIACISAAAASVSALIATANGIKATEENHKALELYSEGNPAAARYYGNIDGLSDYYNKTDMGDAETNEKYEEVGERIDKAKKVADTVKIVTDVASLGIVKDYRYTVNKEDGYKGYDLSYENIKKNIMHEAGYRYKTKTVLREDGIRVKRSSKVLTNGFDFATGLNNYLKSPSETNEKLVELEKYFSNKNPSAQDTSEALKNTLGILGQTGDYYDTIGKYPLKVGEILENSIELAAGE